MSNWEDRLKGQLPVQNGFTSEMKNKVREGIRMGPRKKASVTLRALPLVTAAILLTGLWVLGEHSNKMPLESNGIGALAQDPYRNQDFSLTILSGGYDGSLRKKFLIRHPSLNVGMVFIDGGPHSKSIDDYEKLLDDANMDVVQVPLELYGKLAEEGRLLSLEPYLAKEKDAFNELYHPAVDFMKDLGGDKMYGLPFTFQSTALFINPDLFAQYGIPIPEDGSTMEDILGDSGTIPGHGDGRNRKLGERQPGSAGLICGTSVGSPAVQWTDWLGCQGPSGQ